MNSAPAFHGDARRQTLAELASDHRSVRAVAHMASRAAEAVATLHARGEVHGALTPDTFVVGRGDRVELIGPSAPATAEERLRVLRYAAPEAARDRISARAADAFSLGLVIRSLLEGAEPRSTSGDELLSDALSGRVDPIRLGGAGTDGIVRVLERAARSDPSERPSAPEFVAALRESFHPRGLQRQEWVIGAVAAAAVLVVMVLLHRSSSERERSARQFENTRAAVEGLLAGTYPELGRIEDLEAVAAAGRSALQSLASLREADATDAADALYARALLWNGEVERRLGQTDAAREHYDAAVAIAGGRERRDLDSGVALPALLGLAELAMTGRDAPAAAELLDRAIAVAGQPGEGDTRALRLLRARVWTTRGEVALALGGRGDGPPAREVFAQARAQLAALEAQGPDADGGDRDSLALSARLGRLEALGAALRGDFERAAETLEGAAVATESLVQLDPGNVEARHADARVHDALGRARVRLGDFPDSIESFREALDAWSLLVEMDARTSRWRAERMRTMRELATSLDRVGAPGEASAFHDLALDEARELQESGALGPAAHVEYAAHALTAGEGRLAAGDLRGASERVELAAEALRPKPAGKPLSVQRRDLLARRDVLQAEIALAQGGWDEAEVAANRFLDLYGRLARNGRAAGLRECRVRAMLVTASIRAARGLREDARDLRRRALGVARKLSEEQPDDASALALLARTLFVLGDDAEAAEVLGRLDASGYRGLELSAVRAATAHLQRR